MLMITSRSMLKFPALISGKVLKSKLLINFSLIQFARFVTTSTEALVVVKAILVAVTVGNLVKNVGGYDLNSNKYKLH